MRGIALVALGLLGCTPDYSVLEDVQELQFTDSVTRVEVDVENGSVELMGWVDDLTESRVEVTSRWTRRVPTWDAVVDGDVLRVKSRCPDQRACATDVRLRVPPAVDATVESRAGDLVLGRLAGELEASTQAGSVDLSGFRGGRVDLYSKAGTLYADDVQAEVVLAYTEAGPIELHLDGAIRRVVADSDGGSVLLDVPAGGYRLDLETAAGTITLADVYEEPGADGALHAQTDAGSIEVEGHAAISEGLRSAR